MTSSLTATGAPEMLSESPVRWHQHVCNRPAEAHPLLCQTTMTAPDRFRVEGSPHKEGEKDDTKTMVEKEEAVSMQTTSTLSQTKNIDHS